MNAKRWAALGIAGGIFIVSFMVKWAFSFAFSDSASGGFFAELFEEDSGIEERTVKPGVGLNRIAIIEVNGVIQDIPAPPFFAELNYHHRSALKMFEKAMKDDKVKGVILRVDSPGGGVVESAEIHKKITEIREQADKPVYVSMGSVAASGGYYISAPATKIYASPATMTGSLGVIMESMNFSELAEKIGIDFNTITSGPHKDIGSPSREMTDDERKILQSMVDNAYDDFVTVIAEGRGMSESEVKKIADGRIYDGKQAKEKGLIDELGSLDDAIEALKEDIGDNKLGVIQYKTGFGFSSFLQVSAQKMFQTESDLIGIKQLISSSNSPRLMYLYTK